MLAMYSLHRPKCLQATFVTVYSTHRLLVLPLIRHCNVSPFHFYPPSHSLAGIIDARVVQMLEGKYIAAQIR